MSLLTLDPNQDYDHLLDIVSGYDGMHDLQFTAPVDPELPAEDGWERGSLISLDANGMFKKGCGDTEMPLWTNNAVNGRDFDVSRDRYNASGGNVTGFVATGGYEMKTTEFDETQTYQPNNWLVPGLGSLLGKVTLAPADSSGRLVCGVVSQTVLSDSDGQSILHFWPVFLPPRSASGSSS